MPSTSSRRRFLTAASVLFVAGCTESDSDDTPTGTRTETPGTATPTETPTETPTATATPTETPEEVTPVPELDTVPHEVIEYGVSGILEEPTATTMDGDYAMAYLPDDDALERLALEELGDEEKTFIDETDFSISGLVAIEATTPSHPPELVDLAVFEDPESSGTPGSVLVAAEITSGPFHAMRTLLLLVRVTPDDGPPEHARAVVEQHDERIELDPTEGA